MSPFAKSKRDIVCKKSVLLIACYLIRKSKIYKLFGIGFDYLKRSAWVVTVRSVLNSGISGILGVGILLIAVYVNRLFGGNYSNVGIIGRIKICVITVYFVCLCDKSSEMALSNRISRIG